MSLRPKPVDFEQTWSELEVIVSAVMQSEFVSKPDWQLSFSLVYGLCTAHGTEGLFERSYQSLNRFLEKHVDFIKEKMTQTDDKLGLYQHYWSKYFRGSELLNYIFMYMNKHHIASQKISPADQKFGMDNSDKKASLKEVNELALDVWKVKLLEPLSSDLVTLLLDAIRNERQGNMQKESVIHDTILSFVEVDSLLTEKLQLSTYKHEFEKRYLTDTESHYRDEASRLRVTHSCSEYMVCVLDRLSEETRRCGRYLHRSSLDHVIDRCSLQMVTSHLDFLQAETAPIFRSDRYADLKNMYKLFKPYKKAIDPLNDVFYKFIKEKGVAKLKALFQNPNEPTNENTLAKQFVDAVLEVHGHFSGIIRQYLDNDQQFQASLDKAFMVIVNYKEDNSKTSRSSELLARYCDVLLKKGKVTDSEIDEKLSLAITVLKYIEEPDVFQKFYQRNLARRLIQNQSNSMDAEESMIKQLKIACGFDFINKLNRMFTDIGVSSDLNQKFNDFMGERPTKESIGFSFNIHVLSAGFWPLHHAPAVTVVIPDEIQKCVQLFQEFYNHKFNGRRLLWLHHLCTGDIKLGGYKKPYIANMSTCNLAVLTLFNRSSSLSIQEIQQATDIPEDTLIKVIETMSTTFKILTIEGPLSSQSSTICINEDFSHKLIKFKINQPTLQKEQEREIQTTRNSVEEDRRMFIQAAIVRIMKARKHMKHDDLINEVVRQSIGRFSPTSIFIKRAIEGLIEKQYLERVDGFADEYVYMA